MRTLLATSERLRRAAADVLTRPALYWAVAAVFGARVIVLGLFAGERPDTEGLWLAARTYPDDVYAAAADFIASHRGLLPPPQGPGYLGLPTNIVLALPLRSLSEPAFITAWVLFDGACVLVSLVLLMRLLEPLPALARATAWAAAAVYAPLFAEIQAGQRGGPILLLGVLAMSLARRSTIAGALVGAATSLKLYPFAMVLGAPAVRFVAAATVVAAVLLLAGFAPLGGPSFYVAHVLVPALSPSDSDCAINSVRSLWMRALGGEPYWWLGPGGGLVRVQSPLHVPLLAQALTYATDLALVAAAAWAARRAGFGTPYALAVTFALGAVVPGEVYPYQFLPLLPVLVMVLAAAVARRRWAVAVALAGCLAAFVRPPCATPFPNLWTVGAVAAFLIAVWQHAAWPETGRA